MFEESSLGGGSQINPHESDSRRSLFPRGGAPNEMRYLFQHLKKQKKKTKKNGRTKSTNTFDGKTNQGRI